MRVLLTGSTGLVGSASAAHLRAAGHEVVGVSRSAPPWEEPGEHAQIDLGTADAAERLAARVARCDGIVHTAASLEPSDEAAIVLTNCLGTQQVLALARRWGIRRLVFLSSIQVIGKPQDTPITEDHRLSPVTAYHASKLFGERLVERFSATGGSGCSLRLVAPLGAGMPRDRIVPTFVARALRGEIIRVLGRGSRRQSYVDVRDAARAIQLALTSDAQGPINVAGMTAVSNFELAELCVSRLGSGSPIEVAGTDTEEGICWEVSIQRATEAIKYHPDCSLADSIDALAAEMSEQSPPPPVSRTG